MQSSSEIAPCWRAANAPPVLAQQGIHLWRVALVAENETVARLACLLDVEEQDHAARLRTAELRRRFIVRRARLRQILALYAAESPDALRFDRGPHGKPRLAGSQGNDRIEFSASHSVDWALVAIAAGRPVGVDIEQVRPIDDMLGLARQYFAPAENETLANLPARERLEVFFRLWVCKEAVLKALGMGISAGLDQVVVSPSDSPPRIVAMAQGHDPAAWRLELLRAAPGFPAAVAWQGQDAERGGGKSLEQFEFPADRV